MTTEVKTFTKDELDAAVKKAVDDAVGEVDGLKTKVDELKEEKKKIAAELRKTQDIKPEDVAALEHQVDELTGKLTVAEKATKDAEKARDIAVKSLETESGAARNYARDADINAAIANGNVAPAYVAAYRALLEKNAKTELVDGKYVTTIGDKPADEYVKTDLASEDGKAFQLAAINGGGGAGGGNGAAQGTDLSKLPPVERITAARAAASAK